MRRVSEQQRAVLAVGAAAALLTCLAVVYAQRRRGDAPQVRPRRTTEQSSPAAATTLNVKAGGDLQAALRAAKYGDTIVLAAGATYTGPLTLPYKGPGSGTDADYITIRTSELAGIPAEGERVRPALHARAMPKIVAPANQAAVATEERAHHYRFVGVEFAPAAEAGYVYNLISLGGDGYASTAQFSHHLVFDRCYVHSTGLNKARRGFALNSGEAAVLNSHVSGFAGAGDETQAIAGWNGPGPFRIVNNYLEGGGENIMFGGADPAVADLVPSDIEIRRNHIYKPAGWFGRAVVKAMVELKNARRVRIDGNLIESGGRCAAFVLTVRNQDGKAPWSTIEDVEITNNVVRHMGGGVNILGRDDLQTSRQAKRLKVVNNLFADLGTDGGAMFLKINGAEAVTVERNTVQHTGNIIISYGNPSPGFVFRDNIAQYNSDGLYCENGPHLLDCFPRGHFAGNVIADNANVAASGYPIDNKFPPKNFFPRSFREIGFVDYAGGDWRLAADSRYRGRGATGADPGVNYDALKAAGALDAASGPAGGQ